MRIFANMKHILYVISVFLVLTVLASCTDKEAMRQRLDYVSQCNRADTVFTEAWLPTVDSLVNYFDRHGNANEKMMAHYLKGRVHHDMGEAPIALECYQQATEMADTTSIDCDLRTLASVFSQSASLYKKAGLYQQEISHAIKASQTYLLAGDTLRSILCYELTFSPYYHLNKIDSAVNVLLKTRKMYINKGLRERAALAISGLVYMFLKDSLQLTKAKHYMNVYENESGLFDKFGNLPPHQYQYYGYKGLYYKRIGKNDSAEYYFRKALEGEKSLSTSVICYHGLLDVFKERNNIDSMKKYSELYCKYNDSTLLNRNTEEMGRMAALYDYSRHQNIAAQKTIQATRARVMLGVFVLFTFVLIGIICIIIWLNRRKQQKKRENILKLEKDLGDAQLARWEVQEELEKLKSNDFESVIAAKEKKEAELTRAIERLQNENNIYKKKDSVKERDCLEDFRNSKIAQLFIRRATGKFEIPRPTDAEWSMLMSQFSKDIPVTFKSFGEGKPLSQLEQRICVLLILDISEKTISIMTDSVPSTVSNAKARASEKLFGKKAAQSLKTNLFHALKQV